MSHDPRITKTIENFGYPDNLICDLGEWIVLLRPKQVTLGSLVLAAADPAMAFGDLHAFTFNTLGPAVTRIEHALKGALRCDKFNYIMLMMVDPHVHFHVIPRYANPVDFHGQSFADPFWPKPPDVTQALDISAGTFSLLRQTLKAAFAS